MNFLSLILRKPSILFNDSPCLMVQPSLVVSFPMVVVPVVEFSLSFRRTSLFHDRTSGREGRDVGKRTRTYFVPGI